MANSKLDAPINDAIKSLAADQFLDRVILVDLIVQIALLARERQPFLDQVRDRSRQTLLSAQIMSPKGNGDRFEAVRAKALARHEVIFDQIATSLGVAI